MSEIVANSRNTAVTITGRVNDYIRHSKADNTMRAYRSDWNHFVDWCQSHQMTAKPANPETVAAYIADLATDHKPSTVERRLASISKAHGAAGFDNPASRRHTIVKETLAGIRRVHGMARTRKAAIRVTHIHAALTSMGDDLQSLRGKAMLLLGYIGALRRSELAGLDVEDLHFTQEGMQYVIRISKTDQESRGETVGIRYSMNPGTCSVRAVQLWLIASGITSGPLFRPVSRYGRVGSSRLSAKAVAIIIKGLAPKLGLDPATVSGHSLRAGFITDQVQQGTPQPVVMKRSRHKSVTVFAAYVREADIYAVDFGAIVGL